MLRVTTGNIVLFTWVGYGTDFWLEDYISAMRGIDLALFPDLRELEEILGSVTVEPVEIPHDGTDGFICAYWRRPRAYLDPAARKAISTFSRIGAIEESLRNLEDDLDSGEWDRKYGHLLAEPSKDLGYRLVVRDRTVARPGAAASADPSGRLR